MTPIQDPSSLDAGVLADGSDLKRLRSLRKSAAGYCPLVACQVAWAPYGHTAPTSGMCPPTDTSIVPEAVFVEPNVAAIPTLPPQCCVGPHWVQVKPPPAIWMGG
jgi:hypothetical protein